MRNAAAAFAAVLARRAARAFWIFSFCLMGELHGKGGGERGEVKKFRGFRGILGRYWHPKGIQCVFIGPKEGVS